MAETKKDALAAFDVFVETWGVIRQGGRKPDQGSRGVAGLLRLSGRALEASAHDERHRKLVRDDPPPHRALQGMSLEQTPLAMIFKLAEAAEKSWRRLDGHNQLPKVIIGVRFADGIEIKSQARVAAACSRPSPTIARWHWPKYAILVGKESFTP